MPDLYVHDDEFDTALEAQTAAGIFGITIKPVGVADWAALGKAVRAQAKWDRVVFSFHAYPGGMLVGGNARTLDEASVRAEFVPANGRAPAIGAIDFMGCDIGSRPAIMLAFADLFGARRVTGFTWSVVKQPFTIDLPKGVNAAKIDAALQPFAPYAAGTLPAGTVLATRAKFATLKHTMVAYYGSADGAVASALPIPLAEQKNLKPWKQATKRIVKASEAAKVEAEFISPIVPFQLVSVTR